MPRYGRLPRRPWFLAPPFHLGGGFDAEVLTVHTIQSREAYETLQSAGTPTGDATRSDWRGHLEFDEAYEWMRRQMNARLGSQAEGLLWFWARTQFRDLAGNAKHARGEVLLTARIARDAVLLSHFNDWHSVLNRSLEVPLLPGETYGEWSPRFIAICDEFDRRAESFRKLPIDRWPRELRTELEASWESIFDLDHCQGRHSVQATSHELRARDVVRAVRIL